MGHARARSHDVSARRTPVLMLALWAVLLLAATGARAQNTAAGGLAEAHRAGDAGPLVVLVPGLGFGWTVFEDTIAALAPNHRVVVVSLVGFDGVARAGLGPPAGSADDPTPWLDAAEAALRSLITDAEDGPAVVVGHSLGGHLALRLVGAPGVAGVVTLDGRAVYEAPGLSIGTAAERRRSTVWRVHADSIRRLPDRTWMRQLAQAVDDGVADETRSRALSAAIRRGDAGLLKHGYLELIASDARPALRAGGCPVLAIIGEVDLGEASGSPLDRRALLEGWGAQFEDAAGPVEVEFIEGAGHWPLENAAARTRRLIENFVAEVTQP